MLVLGDAHANEPARRQALFRAYHASGADYALRVGDLWYYDLPCPTWFIAGNNENFDVIAALRHGLVERSGVSNANLLASTTDCVDGLKIGGISGNYAPSQYHYTRSSLVAERRRHFTSEDIEQAKKMEDIDVLLVHESPHGLSVSENYEVGCDHIDTVLSTLNPSLCLVGHHHEHTETTIEETQVVSLAPAWESYYELESETLELTRQATPTST